MSTRKIVPTTRILRKGSVGIYGWLKNEEVQRGVNYIQYTIQPTDSVAGIAKRFGVDLHRLVELNPQVCTPGPQAGIEIKIPVDDGPVKRLYCSLPELYGSEAPSVFAMIYQIAEVSHNPEIGLEATIEAAAELLEARDITGAFDLLGITKNPSLMYLERADVDSEITYPPSSEHKRFAELKEIRRTYKAVVEWGTPKSAPIAGI